MTSGSSQPSVQNDSLKWQNHFDHPERKLILAGITGTDGKTSTATILQYLLDRNFTGYIGTNGVTLADHRDQIPNTTPAPRTLYKILNDFTNLKAKSAVLELSSEGMAAGRLNDLGFNAIGFTNITSEHLNTHKTLQNYIETKFRIFSELLKPNAFAILNSDDPHYDDLTQSLSQLRPDLTQITYSLDKPADLRVTQFQLFPDHTELQFQYQTKIHQFRSPLLGRFNIENLTCALAIALNLEPQLNFKELENRLAPINIPGRLDIYQNTDTPTVIIDYAHTPNGISELFKTIPALGNFKNIYTVSGQAGSRDSSKRPKVGRLLAQNSTRFIITTEDPHWEDYDNVVRDLTSEIVTSNYQIILDRYQAIQTAINLADPDDLVLVLGKGAETSHSVRDTSVPFSDPETVQELLQLSKL